jgi:hypothetical protein
MNTLLNNEQFAKRLEIIEQTYGKGSIVVFSSKYNGTYTHVKSLDELSATTPRVVIMCSHHTRYKEGHEWITDLHEKRVSVYYDELHYYISTARAYIEAIHDLPHVHSMLGLTATPNPILKKRGKWASVNLVRHDELVLDTYAGILDMQFHAVDDVFPIEYTRPAWNDYESMDEETIVFITRVMEKDHTMFQPGSRTFVPAHIRRCGHDEVGQLIHKKCPQAVIITINGVEKSLRFYQDDAKHTISLVSKQQEVCERIAQVMTEHNLHTRPLFMTGFLCVGMGQTLMHESFGTFTHSIISHLSINTNALYQLFGRMSGRVKHWKTYCQTKLFCPTMIYNRIRVLEQCAINASTQAELTKFGYESPIRDMPEAAEIRKSLEKKSIVVSDD